MRSPETTLATLLQELGASDLRQAVALCEERHRLEERGEIEYLLNNLGMTARAQASCHGRGKRA